MDCSKELVVGASHCHHCGSRIIYHRLNFRDLLVDLFQRVTNLERGLWPTVKDLTIRPGQVCHGYIRGMRKRYTPPATYALIIGSVYAILSLLDSDIYWYEELMGGMSMGGADASSDPEFIEKFIPFRLPLLFLPVYAITLMNRLFYYKQYNWAEQAVVALYYYAHFLLIFLILHTSTVLINNLLLPENPENPALISIVIGLIWGVITISFKIRVYAAVYQHKNKFSSMAKPILAFILGGILNLLPYVALALYFLWDID
ncbi:MAG: DUF3667 domain-containing protein [Bacteroidota bacterium]